MADDNGIGKGLLAGFLTGSIVGAVVALLYAPKSGRELRSDISQKTDEYINDAESYLEQAKDKANDLINEGKKKSEKLVADAKVKVDGLLKEAEDILSDAKNKAGDFVDTQKETLDKESNKIKSAVKAGLDSYKKEKNT
jgi:gas vesicle protein